MTPCGTGRFCNHCQKTVIDFTSWADTALYTFFSKNTENVCGRMFAAQLQRPINIPPQPHSRLYRLTIALGLTLIFSEMQQTFGQNRPPKVTKDSIIDKTDTPPCNKKSQTNTPPEVVIKAYRKPIVSSDGGDAIFTGLIENKAPINPSAYQTKRGSDTSFQTPTKNTDSVGKKKER